MTNTKQWAAAHGVCVEDTVPPVDDYNEQYERTAEEVAMRTIMLHGVAAVGYEVGLGFAVGTILPGCTEKSPNGAIL